VAQGEVLIIEGVVKARPAQEGRKGYWIGRQDISDPAEYKKYVDGTATVFAEYGGLFLVRSGPHQAMEGQARARNVLIEFPSVKHALDCFHSDPYQTASAHRRLAAIGEIIVVEGV
jgi:uncharacterized protein (DUF1330 family)